jgi:hypothetical protein
MLQANRIQDGKKRLAWTAIMLGGVLVIGVCLYLASAFGVSRPEKNAGAVIDEMKHPTASAVIQGLMHTGVCKQLPDNSAWTGTDYGKLLEKDLVGSCLTYKGEAPKAVSCDSTIYVTVDPEAAKTSPKRALVYEDSMSVALLYGSHWQLEIAPAFGSQDPIKVTLANCKEKVKSVHALFGGQITRFGQYK